MSDIFVPDNVKNNNNNNNNSFCGSNLLRNKNLFKTKLEEQKKRKKERTKKRKKRKKRWLLEAEAKQPYDDTTIYWIRNKSKIPPSPTRTIITQQRPKSPPLLYDINTSFNQPIDEELDMMITTNRTTNNNNYPDVSGLIFRNVNKRATIDPKKTTCMLYLQADHQFYQKYGTEEACIEVMTRHVQRVNSIYKNTGEWYRFLF